VNLVEFVNEGGNVLVAGSSVQSDLYYDFAIEFSVDFDDKHTAVTDHFYGSNGTLSSSHVQNPAIALPFGASTFEHPILFRGVAVRLTGKNALTIPVLTANPTSFSFAKDETLRAIVNNDSPFLGTKIVLVAAHQSMNNARVTFTGSLDLLTNK
jgi:oligosaccharyltransferase complex subunit beta